MRKLIKRMSKTDWQLLGAFASMLVVIVVVSVLFTSEDGSGTPITNEDVPKVTPTNINVKIPEKYQKIDYEEIGDLNEDGELNVLDMIIFVQEGE